MINRFSDIIKCKKKKKLLSYSKWDLLEQAVDLLFDFKLKKKKNKLIFFSKFNGNNWVNWIISKRIKLKSESIETFW